MSRVSAIGCSILACQTESWSMLKWIQPAAYNLQRYFHSFSEQNIYDFGKLPHKFSFRVGYLHEIIFTCLYNSGTI